MGQRSREIAEREFDVSVVEARYLSAIARATAVAALRTET
jgi:hypothetical protein